MAELYNSTRIYNDSTITYDGAVLAVQVTATGSGTSTESADILEILARSATGSGLGSSTVTKVRIVPRTATGSGAGTETADGLYLRVRQATGTGTGTSTTVSRTEQFRTATGSGTGTSIAVGRTEQFRTATGTGTGSGTATRIRITFKTASGLGTGSASLPNWTKSLIFRTPNRNEIALNGFDVDIPWTEEVRVANNLLKFYNPLPRGINVYKTKAGVYTEREPIAEDIDIIYFGGHDNFVTPEEKADLVAAGYTVS